MTRFEQRLQKTKSYNRILNLEPTKKDNLSEEEVIVLKAKYLGTSTDSVKFNVEKMRLYKGKKNLYKKLRNIIMKVLAQTLTI